MGGMYLALIVKKTFSKNAVHVCTILPDVRNINIHCQPPGAYVGDVSNKFE